MFHNQFELFHHGDVLKILVGQQPIDVAWLNGGGGGTFVIKN